MSKPLKKTYIKHCNGKDYVCNFKEYKHICKHCGKEFISHKSKQNYCSRSCGTKDNYNGFTYNDESFFKNSINTEHKAYILGLIMSDGSISEDKISISLNDKDLIEQIRDLINPKRKIYNYKKSYTIMWANKEDLQFLKSIGVTTNKSYDASVYFGIPNNLMCHYIRGWFDGDGCVFNSNTHDKKTNKIYSYTYVSFTTGSLNAVQGLQKMLEMNEIFTTCNQDNRKNVWYVTIKRKEMVNKFKDFIYNNATIKLDRKYHKFMR